MSVRAYLIATLSCLAPTFALAGRADPTGLRAESTKYPAASGNTLERCASDLDKLSDDIKNQSVRTEKQFDEAISGVVLTKAKVDRAVQDVAKLLRH